MKVRNMIGRTISHFQIVKKIGQGGMGVVYKALDLDLNRPVVLKTLPPEYTADAKRKRRFIQEAQAASALNHRNIVTVLRDRFSRWNRLHCNGVH